MARTTSSRVKAVGAAFTVVALALTIVAIAVARSGPERPPAGFVYAEDGQFMLDGEPFEYAGTNAYTLVYEPELGVDLHMTVASDLQLEALRVWAFYDTGAEDGEGAVEVNRRGVYFQYWDPAAGAPAYNDGASGLEHLDYLLYSAREHDIKLVLPLVNNWTAFGGVDQYVAWADGEYHDDFFTDPQIRQWYKDWVTHVLNRVNPLTGIAYKDDPTVMIWELGNELRCSDSGPYPSSPECGSDIFIDWAAEMSDHVRSLTEHHLIGFGGEGFLCTEPDSASTLYNCQESGDPETMLALENIDVHGIHVYPNHWEPTEPDGWEDWAAGWIAQHGEIANAAGVPYYIGEYGWTNLSERMLVFDHWLTAFEEAGGDGSHFWIMQPAASIGQPPDSVGFTQRCPGPACNLVSAWSQHLRDGVPWSEFGPIADNDQAFVEVGGQVTIDVLANDKVFGDATWDPASIDLDPETPGVQDEVEASRGTARVVDGQVLFAQDPDDTQTGGFSYVVADSEGRASEPVRVSVVVTGAS